MSLNRTLLASYLILIPAIGISSCAKPQTNTCQTKATSGSIDVIRIGMDFEKADAMLKTRGAEPEAFQVAPSPEDTKRGIDFYYYKLPSGAYLHVFSEPGETGRVVKSIFVSTYEPKSWKGKTDPERDKFFESFREIREYDFDRPAFH